MCIVHDSAFDNKMWFLALSDTIYSISLNYSWYGIFNHAYKYWEVLTFSLCKKPFIMVNVGSAHASFSG